MSKCLLSYLKVLGTGVARDAFLGPGPVIKANKHIKLMQKGRIPEQCQQAITNIALWDWPARFGLLVFTRHVPHHVTGKKNKAAIKYRKGQDIENDIFFILNLSTSTEPKWDLSRATIRSQRFDISHSFPITVGGSSCQCRGTASTIVETYENKSLPRTVNLMTALLRINLSEFNNTNEYISEALSLSQKLNDIGNP